MHLSVCECVCVSCDGPELNSPHDSLSVICLYLCWFDSLICLSAEINTFPIIWVLFNSQFLGFISASSFLFIISLLSCSFGPQKVSFHSQTDFNNKKAVNGSKTGCERSRSRFQALWSPTSLFKPCSLLLKHLFLFVFQVSGNR